MGGGEGHEDDQSCPRLGSISCLRQFREVARARKKVVVDSAVGEGNWGCDVEFVVVAGGEHDASDGVVGVVDAPVLRQMGSTTLRCSPKSRRKKKGGKEVKSRGEREERKGK